MKSKSVSDKQTKKSLKYSSRIISKKSVLSNKISNQISKKISDEVEYDTDKKKKLKKSSLVLPAIIGVGSAVGALTGQDAFKEIKEVSKPRDYLWGLGVEHEMQLMHVPLSGMADSHIMFDSQESTCQLTGDMESAGSCCKGVKNCKKPESNKYLTEQERKWLNNIDWEISGRQAEGCEGGNIILPRTPILMPELVTGNFRNRSIESIQEEMVLLEDKFIELQMKNPNTQEKVKQYGPIKTHACNFLSNIVVPVRPTYLKPNYDFEDKMIKYKDYMGSYHITITLPHLNDISTPDFVNMHRFFGMQFQWMEPLFNGVYFSPDPDSVGTGPNKVQGSARIMIVGWGNFGGSDLRKLGQTKEGKPVPFDRYGIGRATNIKSYWREKVKFADSEKLDLCAKTASPLKRYANFPKKALSIHTSDIRTFAYAPTMEECLKVGSNPSDCPRVDAPPMEPPFGMELRIFDHFNVSYLLDLMRVVVLLAANAQRFPPSEYVYKNESWIEAVGVSMKQGWNGILSRKYIVELRKNLGLKLECDSYRINDVYSTLVKELYQLNKDSEICHMMMENPEVEPKIPEINRYCWELSFNNKFEEPISKFLKDEIPKNKYLSLVEFKKAFFDKFEEYLWRDNIEDLLYALETKRKVVLITEKGKIKKVKNAF